MGCVCAGGMGGACFHHTHLMKPRPLLVSLASLLKLELRPEYRGGSPR